MYTSSEQKYNVTVHKLFMDFKKTYDLVQKYCQIFLLNVICPVTFQELFGPPAYLEKWPLFLPFLCYNIQTQYQKQNLI
jgi:hypothetical protein